MLSSGACELNEWGMDVASGYGEWQDVDRELRSIARRQSGLDAELMRALREAQRVRLWRHLGCVSMMEYLERVFGYSPRVAQERLRTARKLDELPELAAALENHELPFSAVRELTRIATPATEGTWRAAARGKALREIEEMVSGRAEGDLPTTPKKPELQTRRLSYERILPATRARERQLRQVLDSERGERLDDDAFLAAVFDLALGAVTGTATGVGDRAKFQVVRYVCDGCRAGTQLAAGVQIAIDEAEVERAECDAERVSALSPGRATQDIPKKVRRFVELRDQKRCRIPGCRSSACLELHHIEHVEDGGTHEPENIISICDGHHGAHHRGVLWISGTSSKLVVRRADEAARACDDPDESQWTNAHGSALGDREPSAHVDAVDGDREASAQVDAVDGDREARADVGAVDLHQASARARTTKLPRDTVARSRSSRVAHPPPRDAENRALACCALTTLGWKAKTAEAAVDAALAELGLEADLELLVRRALQRCR